MATIDDIVKKSGVSRSTVFRFLNGNKVREASRLLIVEAMEELNYNRDKLTKTYNYNFEISVSPEYMHFIGFTEMIQGIMETCEENNIRVNLVIRSGKQIDSDYSDWKNENSVGVLVIGKNIEDEMKEAKYLSEKKIPHIFVNHKIEMTDVSYVCVDLEQAAYEMVSYLIARGHEDILVVGNTKELIVDKLKIDGYKRALADHGLSIKDDRIIDSTDIVYKERVIKEILQDGKDLPSAFFGICDSKAIKFINMARAYDVKVPEDISVVGMDNIDMGKYIMPAITTVDVPFKLLGQRSAQQLIGIMNGEYTIVKAMLKHNILHRDSVTVKK